MQRPFEGIRVIDATHVLAGPFAAYQLAVLGADVIKVEHPEEFDQSRETGSDRELNRDRMGTSFLTQALEQAIADARSQIARRPGHFQKADRDRRRAGRKLSSRRAGCARPRL